MTEHPAVAYLRNAHERAEKLAKAATPGPWFANPHDWGDDDFDADIGTRPADHPDRADVVGHGWEGGGVAYQRDADFIAANSPDTVLARVAAERAILAEHRPYQEIHLGPLCFTCVGVDTYRSGVAIHQFFPCNVAVGLAKAWGWTEAP